MGDALYVLLVLANSLDLDAEAALVKCAGEGGGACSRKKDSRCESESSAIYQSSQNISPQEAVVEKDSDAQNAPAGEDTHLNDYQGYFGSWGANPSGCDSSSAAEAMRSFTEYTPEPSFQGFPRCRAWWHYRDAARRDTQSHRRPGEALADDRAAGDTATARRRRWDGRLGLGAHPLFTRAHGSPRARCGWPTSQSPRRRAWNLPADHRGIPRQMLASIQSCSSSSWGA